MTVLAALNRAQDLATPEVPSAPLGEAAAHARPRSLPGYPGSSVGRAF